jgi:hypothetical protein
MKYITCPECGKRFALKPIMKELAKKGGSVSSEAKKQAARKREERKRKLREQT